MTNLEKIMNKLDVCTTQELTDLVPMLEKKWGIECPQTQEYVPPTVETIEQTEFNVILVGCKSGKRIKIIQEIRKILGLGLKESKDVVDNLPATVIECVTKDQAEELKLRLEEIGGIIEIK